MARPRDTKEDRDAQVRPSTGADRLIGCIRASSADQSNSGHSLAGQVTRLRGAALREGIDRIDVVQDVESGAKQRDGPDDVPVPIMIAWLIKSLVLRYGGLRSHASLIPLACGLILGEFMVGSFWSSLSVILEKPMYTFWIF